MLTLLAQNKTKIACHMKKLSRLKHAIMKISWYSKILKIEYLEELLNFYYTHRKITSFFQSEVDCLADSAEWLNTERLFLSVSINLLLFSICKACIRISEIQNLRHRMTRLWLWAEEREMCTASHHTIPIRNSKRPGDRC